MRPQRRCKGRMARGGLTRRPKLKPKTPRALAYCRPKTVLTMGSTLPSYSLWRYRQWSCGKALLEELSPTVGNSVNAITSKRAKDFYAVFVSPVMDLECCREILFRTPG